MQKREIEEFEFTACSFDEAEIQKAASAVDWLKFDDEKRQIPWVISTDEQDHRGDVVDQKGWDLAAFKKSPRLLWGHMLDGPPAIGSVAKMATNVQLAEKVRGTVALFEFATKEEHPFADHVYMLSRPIGPDGKKRRPHINSSSVGFTSLDSVFPADEKERERLGVGPSGVFHKKSKLLEVSVVNVGMNAGAVQLALKGFADAGVLRDADVEEFLRGYCPTIADVEKAARARLRSMSVPGRARREHHRAAIDALAELVVTEAPQAEEITTRSFDVARQRVEAARLEHEWVSRWCSCEVKHLHALTTGVDRLYAGSFLTGLRHALSAFHIEDTRNLTNDGREVPPAHEVIRLGAKRSDDFLVDGIEFRRGAVDIAVKYVDTSGGHDVKVWTRREDAAVASKILGEAWAWCRENNFLRGEAFSLSGAFIDPGGEGWDDVFLSAENQEVVQRSVRQLNEKRAAFQKRGMIWKGPPGTGKTLCGRVVRNSTEGVTLIWCSSRDFYFTGGTYGIMRAFEIARDLAPAIVFLEDVDSWLGNSATDVLKTEMDGLAQAAGILTVLTTNHHERLPAALLDRPGRFHDVLDFGLPDEGVRLRMVRRWLPDLAEADVDLAVRASAGMSGAHVRELCSFAATIRDQDGVPIAKAVGQAVEKVRRQRASAGVEQKGFHYEGAACTYGGWTTASTSTGVQPAIVRFGGFPVARPGSEVADALGLVARSIEEVATTNDRLEAAITRLEDRIADIGAAGGAPCGAPDATAADAVSCTSVAQDDVERSARRVLEGLEHILSQIGPKKERR